MLLKVKMMRFNLTLINVNKFVYIKSYFYLCIGQIIKHKKDKGIICFITPLSYIYYYFISFVKITS